MCAQLTHNTSRGAASVHGIYVYRESGVYIYIYIHTHTHTHTHTDTHMYAVHALYTLLRQMHAAAHIRQFPHVLSGDWLTAAKSAESMTCAETLLFIILSPSLSSLFIYTFNLLFASRYYLHFISLCSQKYILASEEQARITIRSSLVYAFSRGCNEIIIWRSVCLSAI